MPQPPANFSGYANPAPRRPNTPGISIGHGPVPLGATVGPPAVPKCMVIFGVLPIELVTQRATQADNSLSNLHAHHSASMRHTLPAHNAVRLGISGTNIKVRSIH